MEMGIIFWGSRVWADYQNLFGGLGVGKKGNGDQTECSGGVVFGEESEGEEISNSLWGELSKFIGGLDVGKKAMVIEWKVKGVWYLVKKVQGKVERL